MRNGPRLKESQVNPSTQGKQKCELRDARVMWFWYILRNAHYRSLMEDEGYQEREFQCQIGSETADFMVKVNGTLGGSGKKLQPISR